MANGLDLKKMFQAGSDWLERHVTVVNGLNVFPVPDGDTGTNMLLTMRAALQEIERIEDHDAGAVAAAAARGALWGARGNSGVILSQLLHGLALGLAGKVTFTGGDLAQALKLGVQQAYQSVAQPVEGTILTVARAAAEAAQLSAGTEEDVVTQLAKLVAAARLAQAQTPALLPVLKEAGVTDSGGQGLLCILEGALQGLSGEKLEPAGTSLPTLHPVLAPGHQAYNYDVQFLIHGAHLEIEQIRARLKQMGDSVLVVGDQSLVKVHLHTADPEAPLAYGRSLGLIDDIIVENMAEQARAFLRQPAAGEREQGQVAIVAVVEGGGLVEIFRSLGADRIVTGGPTLTPTAGEWLAVVEQMTSENILILPNHENTLLAVQQVQKFAPRRVQMVPTRTIPQGIAALLAFNRQAPLKGNLKRMAKAAQSVVTFELSRSSLYGRDSWVGDVVGLCHNHLESRGQTEVEVALALLDRLQLQQYELMTIYPGQAVIPEQAQALVETIAKSYPSLQVELYEGGQSGYHYIISLE